jgi:predicted nucleotidyltransferase
MTVDRDKVLAVLRAKRDEIEQRYGIRIIGLVGSVARGEATEGSDIDVVADVTGLPSFFGLSDAEADLATAVGLSLPVEIVLREGMRPASREHLERDLLPF